MKKDKFDQFINSKLHKEEMLRVKGGENPTGEETKGGIKAYGGTDTGYIQYTSDLIANPGTPEEVTYYYGVSEYSYEQ